MFAIIKTGGKQYKAVKNNILKVEKLEGEVGSTVEFKEILLLGHEETATVGSPCIDGAVVTAKIVNQYRDKKILVFKKHRRQNYRRKNGHRQSLTALMILDIIKN
jgi:large subunit ribosomal protein L21